MNQFQQNLQCRKSSSTTQIRLLHQCHHLQVLLQVRLQDQPLLQIQETTLGETVNQIHQSQITHSEIRLTFRPARRLPQTTHHLLWSQVTHQPQPSHLRGLPSLQNSERLPSRSSSNQQDRLQ